MVVAAGKHFSTEMQECIDQCTRCHQACLTGAGHALRQGGEIASAHHIRVLSDCIEICETSANFMLRGSPNHRQICQVCARICLECAEECEKFEDPVMRECAELCRRCAESCGKMAGA